MQKVQIVFPEAKTPLGFDFSELQVSFMQKVQIVFLQAKPPNGL